MSWSKRFRFNLIIRHLLSLKFDVYMIFLNFKVLFFVGGKVATNTNLDQVEDFTNQTIQEL